VTVLPLCSIAPGVLGEARPAQHSHPRNADFSAQPHGSLIGIRFYSKAPSERARTFLSAVKLHIALCERSLIISTRNVDRIPRGFHRCAAPVTVAGLVKKCNKRRAPPSTFPTALECSLINSSPRFAHFLMQERRAIM
jgi:hypothetical protein